MRILLVPLLSLAACDGGELIRPIRSDIDTAGFQCDGSSESDLADADFAGLSPSGCQGRIYASDTLGYVAFTLDVPAFATAFGGEAATVTYTLPDDTVRLTVEKGCVFAADRCGSVDEPVVFRTYTPTLGTLAVTTTPDGDDVRATVTLTDVTFVDDTGDTHTLATLTFEDVRLSVAR